VGYWSDKNLYQGAMEGADIAFRPDGNGWTYWSRIGYSFFIQRFGWDSADGNQLVLDLREELSGRWYTERYATRHRVTSRDACDTKIVLSYEIHAGDNVLGEPATLLEVSQPVSLGTIGNRFAFERTLAASEDDPVRQQARRPRRRAR
jgi:hypothetical protein